MKIDVHAHYLPPEWVEAIRRDGAAYGSRVDQDASGRSTLRFGDGRPSVLLPDLSDLPARLRWMDEHGLDRQVLLPPMTAVSYELDERYGQAQARLYNETNAQTARGSNGRCIAVASVPMQSSRAAVEELDYAVEHLGIRMVEIGTNILGLYPDEERFQPFFTRATELGVLVLLHPHQVAAADRLGRYYLANLVGNPMDTTIAAASLILGGVLERLPSLNLCLVHGGGALPFLLGRVSHGYEHVKVSHTVPQPPRDYARRLYFDTLTHDPQALRFLHDLVGSERLMLGTDYPYDMGEYDPLDQLEQAGLANDTRILGGNAARLLGLAEA